MTSESRVPITGVVRSDAARCVEARRSRSLRRACGIGAVGAILASIAGCGSSATLPVAGSVRLADGTPVVGATVVFESAQHRVSPSGTTDAAGAFTLTAFERDDGAPAGEYRIAIHPPMAADSSERQPASPFDERYASASTSGLVFTVAPGAKPCDLVLDPRKRR